ncbi:MAG: type II toxin-antitoxin system prevent-host-death family antitoxin [Nostoc sp.]|uniref:type II toxin-antitoxin system Phd/YefM family antitoxin n=1 Tax=Nostoc sp. TaxID=1180 RepID=UPI002FF9E1A7
MLFLRGFQPTLYKIFQEVEQGESVQITRQGQQVAVILPTAEYERLLHRKLGFWESVERFRQEIIEEGTEIDPDEVWKDVRDKSLSENSKTAFNCAVKTQLWAIMDQSQYPHH